MNGWLCVEFKATALASLLRFDYAFVFGKEAKPKAAAKPGLEGAQNEKFRAKSLRRTTNGVGARD
jgi:hypothetical protein